MRMMFQPGVPIEFKKPPVKRESKPYNGIASLITQFETQPPPERPYFEAPVQRKLAVKEKLSKLNDEKNELLIGDWHPQPNPKATS
jgi:hypothetical protein